MKALTSFRIYSNAPTTGAHAHKHFKQTLRHLQELYHLPGCHFFLRPTFEREKKIHQLVLQSIKVGKIIF
jgi:hypothetical protein